MSQFSVLLGDVWLLGTFVNSSCDIKINIKIVKIASGEKVLRDDSGVISQIKCSFI